jgi:hypothetical protein
MFPDFTALVLFHVTNEELDKGGFTGTVGTENGDTGGERDLEGDVVELLDGLRRILETDLTHLQQTLFLGLDTLKERRVRELELVILSSLKSVVRLGLRDGLDELLEVTAVSPELEAVQVEDVGDGVVQEARIVRDDDGSASLEVSKVVLQPSNVDDIKMVSRLIKQENVSPEKHGPSKSELHLPTTRKRSDSLLLTFVGETNRGKGLYDFGLVSQDTLVGKDELENTGVFLTTVNVVLDVEGPDFIRGWETFDLAVGDSTHESRLSGTVLTAQTVAVTTLETEGSSVEKNLGTVRKRELTVAKVFTLLLIFGNLLVIGTFRRRFHNPLPGNSNGVRSSSSESEVRSEHVPLGNIKVLEVDEVGREGSSILDGNIGGRDLTAEFLVDTREGAGKSAGFRKFDRRKIRAIAGGGNLTNLAGVLMALPTTPRASGSPMVVSTFIKPGRSLGMKGRTVTGESTSLDMLSTITATFRLVAVNFSLRPRARRGTMRERVGESTSETNVVAERSMMVLGTSSTGLIRALIRAGIKRSISLFDTSAVAFVSESRAAFFTSALVSQMASERTGMISGIRRAVWVGALLTSWFKMTREPVLTCHLPAVLIS